MMLDLLKGAWRLVSGSREECEAPWATDEDAFEEHFEQSYSEFSERLDQLDQAHQELYERTLEVNPEAAVCWVFFNT